MDAAEFDRLIARAQDPQLVPGIYDYCDGRCPRCRFTDRCLIYRENQELRAAGGNEGSLADWMRASAQRTLELVAEVARRDGLDFYDLRAAAAAEAHDEPDRHRLDPLVIRAREYGHFAWRVGRALTPIVAVRGDAGVIDAVETIEWFASMIGSKISRAVWGRADGREPPGEAQTDSSGKPISIGNRAAGI